MRQNKSGAFEIYFASEEGKMTIGNLQILSKLYFEVWLKANSAL